MDRTEDIKWQRSRKTEIYMEAKGMSSYQLSSSAVMAKRLLFWNGDVQEASLMCLRHVDSPPVPVTCQEQQGVFRLVRWNDGLMREPTNCEELGSARGAWTAQTRSTLALGSITVACSLLASG
jgi:hypothetical protein